MKSNHYFFEGLGEHVELTAIYSYTKNKRKVFKFRVIKKTTERRRRRAYYILIN